MIPLCLNHTGMFPFHYRLRHGRVTAVCSLCRQPRAVWPEGMFPPLHGVNSHAQQECVIDSLNEYIDRGGWVREQHAYG